MVSYPQYSVFLTRQQLRLTYTAQGDLHLPVLLLIHGLGSYQGAWYRNLEGLSAHFHCIAVDLPGYGTSDKRNFVPSMSFYAQVLHDFLLAMQLRRKITLVGHSMGGQIALWAAYLFPDLFDNLVLTAPAGFEKFNELQKIWLRQTYAASFVEHSSEAQIRHNFALNFYHQPPEAETMIQYRLAQRKAADFLDYCAIIPQSIAAMLAEPPLHFVKNLQQRTLLIFGEKDKLIPNRLLNPLDNTAALMRRAAALLPSCEAHLIPNCGHFAQFEQSAVFNNLLIQYLSEPKR